MRRAASEPEHGRHVSEHEDGPEPETHNASRSRAATSARQCPGHTRTVKKIRGARMTGLGRACAALPTMLGRVASRPWPSSDGRATVRLGISRHGSEIGSTRPAEYGRRGARGAAGRAGARRELCGMRCSAFGQHLIQCPPDAKTRAGASDCFSTCMCESANRGRCDDRCGPSEHARMTDLDESKWEDGWVKLEDQVLGLPTRRGRRTAAAAMRAASQRRARSR